jgi:SAM-dependent methyltransferase
LNRIFAEIMVTFEPRVLAVLGCATGNGFEHIRPDVTERVFAIDINQEYLDILAERYGSRLPGLHVACNDVKRIHFAPGALDHVHAGLIYEYVRHSGLLKRIANWLKPGGVLSVVFQMPSTDSAPVTHTSYESLKRLEPIMRLVDPEGFSDAADHYGLLERKSFDVELKQGKKFRVIYYVKTHV